MQFLDNNNTFHLPYSSDLSPCDFALFSKLKMKLRERRLSMSNVKRESQAVFNSSRKNDSKNVEIGVCMRS